MRQSSW